MVTVKIKGIYSVRSKGRTYHYAWRNGPRLRGEPGSLEFLESYQEALASRRPKDDDRIRALVTLYRSSPAFTGLADSTRKQWNRWLDRIVDHFGELRVAQFDRADKIRPVIRRWRNRWADKPRTADYGLQVMSRLLSHAVDLDKISANPCEGIKQLYRSDRADLIWTDDDLAKIKAVCTAEVAHIIDLASLTGLRAGDLGRLSWGHVQETEIVVATGKSGERTEAVIPLYPALQACLASIPKRSTVVLTNKAGHPWSAVNDTMFTSAKAKAGLDDLHFHDLRGTAATRFYLAGIEVRDIAEIMGWSEDRVSRIIRKYVGRKARSEAIIRKLSQTERGT